MDRSRIQTIHIGKFLFHHPAPLRGLTVSGGGVYHFPGNRSCPAVPYRGPGERPSWYPAFTGFSGFGCEPYRFM